MVRRIRSAAVLAVLLAASTAVTAGSGTRPAGASTTTWKGQLVGVPPGTAAPSRLELNAVSCLSASWCMAAGTAQVGANGATMAAVATWNGAGWTTQLLPAAGSAAQLLGVACWSTSGCAAVGTTDATTSTPLVATFDGASWSASALSDPPGTSPNTINELLAVSCPGATSCIAVGRYVTAGGEQPLAATWSGSSWQLATSGLLPTGATGGHLRAVSCTATTACTAVGSTVVSGTATATADSLNGSTWTSTTSGLDPSVPVPGGVTVTYDMTGVSCTAAATCTATGSISSGASFAVIVDTESGGAWSPSIADLSQFNFPGYQAVLDANAVSCADTTHCVIAGSVASGLIASSPTTLVFPTGDPSSAESAVGPAFGTPAPNGGDDQQLNGISCPSTTFCVAVGGDGSPGTTVPAIASASRDPWPSTAPGGYALATATGSIDEIGNVQYHGSLSGTALAAPVVGISASPDKGGYWMVASDGGIFAFGDAGFHGSMGGQRLNQPIVGMAATADGKGYWMVASDGGVFAFGDAGFHGSMGGHPLNQPIVGMAATADGKGYWMVASDGGVFALVDAGFHGSMGGHPLNQPIVGMAATADGKGYWMVASDGGIFAFGDAGFHGSAAGRISAPVVAIVATADGSGYWLAASDGTVDAFGDATWQGDFSDLATSGPVVGMTAL